MMKTMNIPARAGMTEQGFSLIEVMVASGILAIGLLALSGMQAISLTKNVDANDLTIATNVASEMMERIQFNRRQAAPLGAPSPYHGIDTKVAGTAPLLPQANGDFNQWRTRLTNSGLINPGGTVIVTPIVTVPPLYQYQVTVGVTWRDKTNANVNRAMSIVSVVAPE